LESFLMFYPRWWPRRQAERPEVSKTTTTSASSPVRDEAFYPLLTDPTALSCSTLSGNIMMLNTVECGRLKTERKIDWCQGLNSFRCCNSPM